MADTGVRRGPLGYLLAAVLVVLFLLLAWQALDLLLLLFIAILFAVYLSAVTDWFQRRLHLPRPLGITLGLLATLLGFGLVGVLLVPPLLAQVADLLAVLPARLMVWESSLVRLAERYPLVRDVLGPVFGWTKPQTVAVFELTYSAGFLCVELLFRGALVIGMARVLGKDAILPMAGLYAVIHFGKPAVETVSGAETVRKVSSGIENPSEAPTVAVPEASRVTK